jgi:hypothetical protein
MNSEPSGLTWLVEPRATEREQQVLGEAASRLLWRHFEGRPVVGERRR